MSIFDDFSQFLEDRLDEFLRNNPHLELQAIEEQLREQQQDTQKLIIEFQDIQVWHGRVSKAEAAGRKDLAEAAKEREAALLRQGNQLWGQMEGVKQSIVKAQELLQQTQQRRQQVRAKYAEVKATSSNYVNQNNGYTSGWQQGVNSSYYQQAADPVEAEFQRWELDEELEQIKRNMKR
jgi:uncharacterized protein (TIGR04376 family)